MSLDEDLSWLDDRIKRSAAEMLRVLFVSSRISVITFDAGGVILSVNAQTAQLGGRNDVDVYRGVNLLSHPIFERLGWAAHLRRVLEGETVELTDSRWVTLFGAEERYIDVIAGPITVEERVVGGVAYLIDATAHHRSLVAEATKRKRSRELEVFLARDVGETLAPLAAWAGQRTTTPEETARAMVGMSELSSIFDDLQQFVQLESYQPVLSRVPVLEALSGAGIKSPPRMPDGETPLAVTADSRLLRRVLRNVIQFSARMGGCGWSVQIKDGRVLLRAHVEGSHQLLKELLTPSSLSSTEADGAAASLAAARWMTEMMHGTLTANESEPIIVLNLPAADSSAPAR